MYRKQILRGGGFSRLFGRVIRKISTKAIPRIVKTSARKIIKKNNIKKLLKIGKTVLKNPKLRKSIKANSHIFLAPSNKKKTKKKKSVVPSQKKGIVTTVTIPPAALLKSGVLKKSLKKKKNKPRKVIVDTVQPISVQKNILPRKVGKKSKAFRGWRSLGGSGIILR